MPTLVQNGHKAELDELFLSAMEKNSAYEWRKVATAARKAAKSWGKRWINETIQFINLAQAADFWANSLAAHRHGLVPNVIIEYHKQLKEKYHGQI